MFPKIIVGLSLAIVVLVSNNAYAIVVTLDDNSLTVARPLNGTTVVDFTGEVTLSTGYGAQGGALSSLWTAGGDMINSGTPDFTHNLSGILFSVTVSAVDGLGLYAFDSSLVSPAWVNFAECQIGGGGCNNFRVNYSLDVVAAAVPEPASVALVAIGLVGLGFYRRKKA